MKTSGANGYIGGRNAPDINFTSNLNTRITNRISNKQDLNSDHYVFITSHTFNYYHKTQIFDNIRI